MESFRIYYIFTIRTSTVWFYLRCMFLFVDPGRVQVFVRLRPRNDDEEARGDPMGVSIEDQQMTQVNKFAHF